MTVVRALLAGSLVLAAFALTVLGYRVRASVRPARAAQVVYDFESMGLRVESVRFRADDGVELAGWWIPVDSDRSPVVLCHDWGSNKAALANLAIRLHEAGFPLLLFDFRGHGDSDTERSTLGVAEMRDVLGALDHLKGLSGIDGSRGVGVYGVGMGAHAAVLAAAERRDVRVLVLDGLYPDAAYPLLRQVYAGWDLGRHRLALLPRGIFDLLSGVRSAEQRAADRLGALSDRDLLLLAPTGDPALASEMRKMYESVPPRPDSEGNLVLLPATHTAGLYGNDLVRHHGQVVDFFVERLTRK